MIYGIHADSTYEFTESRELENGEGQPTTSEAAQLIADCRFVITSKAGPYAATELRRSGIVIVQDYSSIDTAPKRLKYCS